MTLRDSHVLAHEQEECLTTRSVSPQPLRDLFEDLNNTARLEAFGRWCQQQREAAGLTVRDLAFLAGGIAAKAIDQCETGQSRLRYIALVRLFQPWQHDDWTITWTPHPQKPNAVRLHLHGADPRHVFTRTRLTGSVSYRPTQKSPVTPVQSLYQALTTPPARQAFGRWMRHHRLEAIMTQTQIAVILGRIKGQSLSYVESGAFRLSYANMARLFQPWSDTDWTWRFEPDTTDPQTLTLVIEGADPALIFNPARTSTSNTSHISQHSQSTATDPTTAALLVQWERLDSRDRAMVLSVVLRLADVSDPSSI